MKKLIIVVGICLLAQVFPTKGKAQAAELAQLALNVEKLAQFKQILSDLKAGYQILSGGYNTIKNISEGNFKLHEVFLDGLMEVSPAVKNYVRVADIVNFQIRIVKEYKNAFKHFKAGGWFAPKELDYIGSVYAQLVKLSVKNLDDLLTVLTPGSLRMNDEERLAAIDSLYKDMQDKLLFLRSFNNTTSILALQRAKESQDTQRLQRYYDMK